MQVNGQELDMELDTGAQLEEHWSDYVGPSQVQALLQDVFGADLGTMRHFEASLRLEGKSRPVFCKPRPVPFVLGVGPHGEGGHSAEGQLQ